MLISFYCYFVIYHKGTTPQRRDFEYPRRLTRTGPHDKILQEFRRQYIEQEAIQKQLPSDSDDDIATTVCHTMIHAASNNRNGILQLYLCRLSFLITY